MVHSVGTTIICNKLKAIAMQSLKRAIFVEIIAPI